MKSMMQRESDMRIVMIAMLMVFLLTAPVWADNDFKEGAENFKKDVQKAGKEGAENFKRDAKQAGKEAEKTGRSIGEWFKDTGKKIGDAFKELGRNIKKLFTGNRTTEKRLLHFSHPASSSLPLC